MIKYLEKSAKTEDEAIAAALAELGLERDDVSLEIITRAKSGFLGIGATPAVVRISYEVPDEPVKPVEPVKPIIEPEVPEKPAYAPREERYQPRQRVVSRPQQQRQREERRATVQKPLAPKKSAEEIAAEDGDDELKRATREFLMGLLERMGVEAEITIRDRDNGGIVAELSGEGMGAVIGRRGETLDAIQHLTNYSVNNGSGEKRRHISVDAESYRAKREESLVHLAEKMAAKVVKYKRSMALEPMNSYERHVIHTALQNYEGVSTSSTGMEPNRRVVITYDRREPESKKPQSREWA